jgi:general secretion pathway protein I
MVAVSILAIALTAVLSLQSQSVTLASEAKFVTTAPLLAQSKLAEIETMSSDDLTGNSGDFGEEFPGYFWRFTVDNISLNQPENVSEHVKKIELVISWGENEQYQYPLVFYRFTPKKP